MVEVLRGVDLEVDAAEVVAILGPSGSGKSTLLHLLAGLDVPTGGRIYWGDLAVHEKRPQALADVRARRIGLIFQHHYLLEDLTVLENVTLPGRIRGAVDLARGRELVASVDLGSREHAYPRTLSGGERQRVAVARALYAKPPVVLADEPTGSLDRANAVAVYQLLLGLARDEQTAVVLVTHDAGLVAGLARRYALEEGRLRPI